MAQQETQHGYHDKQALLTSAPSPNTPQKNKRNILKPVLIFIFSVIVLAIIIVVLLEIYGVFSEESIETKAGMIGLWPTYGGGLLNQQIPPYSQKILFDNTNIKNVSVKCIYSSPDGFGFTGYPTIDHNNNTYFTDLSGYITCINLETCDVCWRQHIGNLLGYNDSIKVLTFQTLTIFQDSNMNQGILFAAPSERRSDLYSTYPNNAGCYAIAVHLNNGSFWWSVTLGHDNNKYDYKCSSHGFYIDNAYAYGGFAESRSYDLTNNAKYIGRFFKIDIDKHAIVNVWYPFNFNLTNTMDEYNMSYNGISIYNYPSIIDKYVIFGTSNLMRIPNNIVDCLTNDDQDINLNDYLLLNESNYIDMCGNNQSNNRYFRCLQKDINVVSLVILNKNTFKLEASVQLQGLDVFYGRQCYFNSNISSLCPGYYLGKRVIGFNADLTAIATYKYNNKLYVIASQKPSRLHIFEVPSGKLILSRKFGPQTSHGQFSMAVSEKAMIGITSINGGDAFGIYQRYKIFNRYVCNGTGTTFAFDLNNGNILWQVINPYGLINDSFCNKDEIWNEYIDYTDITNTSCEYGEFNDTININIPPKSNRTFNPLMSNKRAQFYGPVTIVNDMVFIPGNTGDIWIHNLYNGRFIHHFTCPNKLVNTTDGVYNRPSIKGGISVVNDRIAFYCGSYHAVRVPLEIVSGNTFVSMKL